MPVKHSIRGPRCEDVGAARWRLVLGQFRTEGGGTSFALSLLHADLAERRIEEQRLHRERCREVSGPAHARARLTPS